MLYSSMEAFTVTQVQDLAHGELEILPCWPMSCMARVHAGISQSHEPLLCGWRSPSPATTSTTDVATRTRHDDQFPSLSSTYTRSVQLSLFSSSVSVISATHQRLFLWTKRHGVPVRSRFCGPPHRPDPGGAVRCLAAVAAVHPPCCTAGFLFAAVSSAGGAAVAGCPPVAHDHGSCG